ncbi:MAG: family 43 glycosylhydrolase [Tepidisphaeraceae bacterium]
MLRQCTAAAAIAIGMMFSPPALLAGNPQFIGADPDAAVFGNEYWIYPTVSGMRKPVFKAYSSKDLTQWTDRGVLLDLTKIDWMKDGGRTRFYAWAPSILSKNGKFFLYYSVGPQSAEHPSRIGVAVADAPDGPFKDNGGPLVTGGNGFEAIDPMAFTDPKTGVTYLYAGGSAGATLRIWELSEDGVTLKREVDVKTPKEFTEGAFVHERDGVYYLSYSHGSWNDSSYSVHYAAGLSPIGPWQYCGRILASDATHKGPGHHSFVVNPKTGETFIVYHRWESSAEKGPYRGSRQIAIERVEYAADGTILPVKMTDAAAPVSPIK